MDIRETLLEKLHTASLSDYEISMWEKAIQNLPENMQQDILNVFSSQPDGIRILTDNLVAKTEALKSGNMKRWDEILEKDKFTIDNISK